MIYRIHPNYQEYKSFVLDSKTVRKALGSDTMFHFSREPKTYGQDWTPFEISFAELGPSRNAGMPDITPRNGRLYLSEAAYEALQSIMAPHGEFLPVSHEGAKGYLFNPLSLAESHDALDDNLCIKNEFGEVESMAFVDKRLEGIDIFRTAFDGYMGIFCSQRFKRAVEDSRLNGLLFSPDTGTAFPPSSDAEQPTKQ